MKRDASYFLLLLFILTGMRMKAQSADTAFNPDKMFQSIGITPVFEFIYDPADFYYQHFTNHVPTTHSDSFLTADEWGATTLLSVTYELRRNFYHYYDKGSASVSFVPAFSLNFYEKAGRLGALALPLFVDLNYGMHSNWNNIDKYGFHIGAGFQAVVGGVFLYYRYGTENRRIYTQPVVRAGMKFPVKKGNRFLDVYYGFGTTTSNIANIDGYSGEAQMEPLHQKTYFKITYGWLIHYSNT